jgi:hypothetical protein
MPNSASRSALLWLVERIEPTSVPAANSVAARAGLTNRTNYVPGRNLITNVDPCASTFGCGVGVGKK